jgi:hypothetical protein
MAMTTLPHELRLIHPDGTEKFVAPYPDFNSGWVAGQDAIHADRKHAYRLFDASGRCVAGFGTSRLTRHALPAKPVTLDLLALF